MESTDGGDGSGERGGRVLWGEESEESQEICCGGGKSGRPMVDGEEAMNVETPASVNLAGGGCPGVDQEVATCGEQLGPRSEGGNASPPHG